MTHPKQRKANLGCLSHRTVQHYTHKLQQSNFKMSLMFIIIIHSTFEMYLSLISVFHVLSNVFTYIKCINPPLKKHVLLLFRLEKHSMQVGKWQQHCKHTILHINVRDSDWSYRCYTICVYMSKPVLRETRLTAGLRWVLMLAAGCNINCIMTHFKAQWQATLCEFIAQSVSVHGVAWVTFLPVECLHTTQEQSNKPEFV